MGISTSYDRKKRKDCLINVMNIKTYYNLNETWIRYNNPPSNYDVAVKSILNVIDNPSEQVIKESFVKDLLKSVGNELKTATKFITTFGTGVAAFYPAVSRLLEHSGFYLDKKDIMLVIVTAASMLVNSKESDELQKQVQEKGLYKALQGTVNFLKEYSKFMSLTRKKSLDVSSSLMDMLGYTSLLVPSVDIITKIIMKENISLDDISKLFTGLAASASAYGIKTLIDKGNK